jgi:hypothetical protein
MNRRLLASAAPLALCAVVALLSGCVPAWGFAATPSGFGFEKLDGVSVNGLGETEMQANSHPRALSIEFALNEQRGAHGEVLGSEGGQPRDLTLSFPAGVVLNGTAVPGCPRRSLDEEGGCAPEYQVGEVVLERVVGGAVAREASPLFNMVAPADAPAELAFKAGGVDGPDVLAYTSVRTASQNAEEAGIDLHILDLPAEGIVGGRIVLFGETPEGAPFLTLPTACGGPLQFAASANTWQEEAASAAASFLSHETAATGGGLVGIEGCDHLGFTPTVSISASTRSADTAAQLTIDVKAPQEAAGLGSSDVQTASVLLPEGMVFNPNRAEGLTTCQPAQSAVGTEGPPSCPATSQVGTAQISTPMLRDTMEGGVYALPSEPPDIEMLITAHADGVYLKLLGVATLNEATGQVTLSIPQAPLLPVSDLRLSLNGGAQGALMTPPACGVYAASTDVTPWVAPAVADAFETSSIEITQGPGGGACVSPLPFSPSLTAGSSIDGAGSFANLQILLSRPDGQQRLSSFQFKAPPGLEAMLSSVPLCGEPQASQGDCPAASEVGQAVLGAGPGGYPLFLPQAGQPPIPIYLTGPYEGAPYGLAIVAPFLAGPYDLGTRVLRARIEMDPRTAQLTIASDPLPRILEGVPLDLRTIYAVLDRPGFVFNPTNCDASSFQGSASSIEGATVALSTPFQVGACQSLQFTPTLTLSSTAKTTAIAGASLTAKIAYPASRQGNTLAGTQANLQSVKIQLPKQLPARIATLRQACPVAVFQANPAGCPAVSLVGHATALTPILAAPLSGPAYLVSHPGEPYPQVVLVLQGSGIILDASATTTIAKSKITTITFTALPDIPISAFELALPEGPHSALAANGGLCAATPELPTELTGQNGAVIDQNAKLAVSGCRKTKAKHGKHTKANKKPKRGRKQ